MPPPGIPHPTHGTQKEWFIPGDGIDRSVISSDIQRYLGNDATVRPGVGSGQDQGVRGYWVRAYRNLTTAMVDDLRASSARWQQEQQRGGTGMRGGNYPESDAFARAGNNMPARFPGEPPLGPMNGAYQDPNLGRGGRMPDRMPDRMEMDDRMPMNQGYNRPAQGQFPPNDRYGPDGRQYPQGGPPFDPRDRDDRMGYNQGADYGRQQPDRQYDPMRGGDMRDPRDMRGDPRDLRNAPGYPPMNGPPGGYGRQPDYYPPGDQDRRFQGQPPVNAMPGRGPDPMYNGPPQFGANQGPPRFEPPRDPRFGNMPNNPNLGPEVRDPRDPRYAYPSPAQSNADPRDSFNQPPPPQHNAFGGPSGPGPQVGMNPQFDQQYGGRPPPNVQQMGGQFPGPRGPPPPGMPGVMPGPLPPGMPGPGMGNLGGRPNIPPPPPVDIDMDGTQHRQRRRLG